MPEFKVPAPDAPAEEWGRLAVSIPGWRWVAGMLNGYAPKGGRVRGMVDDGEWVESFRDDGRGMWVEQAIDSWPDPDDAATAGALSAMMGECNVSIRTWRRSTQWDGYPNRVRSLESRTCGRVEGHQDTLGRACIAAAAALGRWPGGAA